MTAETNHNTKTLICYNKYCGHEQKGLFKRCKKCRGYGYTIELKSASWGTYPNYEDYMHRESKKCKECEGTGKVTWTKHIMGK
jgi:hypothetical protein